MWHDLKLYAMIVPIFVAIDFLWLGIIMPGFYKVELGPLARKVNGGLDPVLWAAFAVWLAIPLGILLFALPRVNPQAITSSAILWGGLFGVVLYAVYDFTNYALIRDWPLRMSLVDVAWGGTICAIVTLIAAHLDRWLT